MEKSYQQLQDERQEIRDRYPQVSFPDPVIEPIWWGRRHQNLVSGMKAIVDQKTGRVFNVCSEQYKIVHYEDVIYMAEEVVATLHGYGQIVLHPYLYADGGKMKLTLKFPEAQHLINRDAIVPKMDIFTSLDLSYKLLGKFGAFVLRCTNGMGVWKHFRQFARKHLLNLNLSDLKQTITEGLSIFGFQVDVWKKWTEQVIDLKEYNEIWQFLPFSGSEKERIEFLPEISTGRTISESLKGKDLTLWSLNSILTQFVTHEVKSELRRNAIEPEIAQIMEETSYRLAA